MTFKLSEMLVWPAPWTQSEADLYKRECLGGIDVVHDAAERQSVHFVGEDSWRNMESRAWKQIWFTDCLCPPCFLMLLNLSADY